MEKLKKSTKLDPFKEITGTIITFCFVEKQKRNLVLRKL